MKLPPLLSSRPPHVRAALVLCVPAVFGAICGWLLGVNEAAYVALAGPVAILGGFGAGLEHHGWRSAAIRGLLGGTVFGTFILIAHEILGEDAKADLPEPAILLVVITALGGAFLGALGGWLRQRRETAGP